MKFSEILKSISDFFKTPQGKKVLKWSQRIINLAVLGWLAYQLTEIGWLNVWQSFPTQPLFYILFMLIFFQLPLFEVLIYRLSWQFNALRSIPIFVLKRVYNKDVLGYSGEVYFFVWAKRNLAQRGREIFKIIKDNNIISSIASTLISIGLLAIFIYTGLIKIDKWITDSNQIYYIIGAVLLVVLVFLFIIFRDYVISMPLKTAYQIFGIQTFRLVLGQALHLLMYYIVLPEVPLYIWFTYLAVNIILSRIPFLPSKDLIYAGIGISIAGPLPVPQDAVAGIMIALGALNKISGFAAFGFIKLFKQTDVLPKPEEDAEAFNKFSKMKEKSAVNEG